MKNPYYVTFEVPAALNTRIPTGLIGASLDVEVGKFHGARIIMNKIELALRDWLFKSYGADEKEVFFIKGIFKL